MYKHILITGLFILSPATFACSPGVAGSGPTGDPNCMGAILSDPGYYGNSNGGYYSSTAPTTKVVYLPTKYGAIVYNPKTGRWDSAFGQVSEQAAIREATRRCEGSHGENAPCDFVLLTYRNGCGAMAQGLFDNGNSAKLYARGAETAQEAERLALKKCSNDGATNCKIHMPAECSLP